MSPNTGKRTIDYNVKFAVSDHIRQIYAHGNITAQWAPFTVAYDIKDELGWLYCGVTDEIKNVLRGMDCKNISTCSQKFIEAFNKNAKDGYIHEGLKAKSVELDGIGQIVLGNIPKQEYDKMITIERMGVAEQIKIIKNEPYKAPAINPNNGR
jgi:hypothetical protein